MLFTIGHSNHELPAFMALLKQHGITAIADVRSQPYSQYTPQFNREILDKALAAQEIVYGFLGRELGARREERECYVDGQARYDRIVNLPLFQKGLEHIRRGAASQRLALMCSEKDPITCHRMILVCRQLRQSKDLPVGHILETGALESNEAAETRLLAELGLPAVSLFETRAEMIEQAYDKQAELIAYRAQPATATAPYP